ncbi:phosphoribosyltransferase [Nitrospira sp. Kam-Ns4a]
MFRDRPDAGRRLAGLLARYQDCPGGLILGIPRGGVLVGLELSLQLRLPLDVFITRKLGAPDNPELAIGALSETGYLHLNQELLDAYPPLRRYVEPERRAQELEIARRRALYRGGRGLPDLQGRTVLLVDDGVATGATYLASVHALKAGGVARLVAALPVAPADTVRVIAGMVDDCVVVACPAAFYAVGQHYLDFRQIEDEEVRACLAKAWRAGGADGSPRDT